MMRVRSDGQLLSADTVRALGEVGRDFARDTADVTDRENIQYHWIRIEDVPAIWEQARRRRARHHRGVRRLAAAVPRLAGGRRRQGRDHRRHRGAGGDQAPLHRQPRVLQPAAQVQDRADRPPQPRRLPRDQRRLLRRHRAPRARPRLRPLGRRRPVDQPDAGPEARRLDPARGGGRRLGGRRLDLPRLRLPPAALARPAEVPGRRLGRGEVPRGARERVPRPRAGLLRVAALPHRPPRPRRRARAEGRQVLRRPGPDRRPDLRHRAGRAGRPDGAVRRRRAPGSRRTRRSC